MTLMTNLLDILWYPLALAIALPVQVIRSLLGR